MAVVTSASSTTAFSVASNTYPAGRWFTQRNISPFSVGTHKHSCCWMHDGWKKWEHPLKEHFTSSPCLERHTQHGSCGDFGRTAGSRNSTCVRKDSAVRGAAPQRLFVRLYWQPATASAQRLCTQRSPSARVRYPVASEQTQQAPPSRAARRWLRSREVSKEETKKGEAAKLVKGSARMQWRHTKSERDSNA